MINIEIVKLNEENFGKNRWAIRVGDLTGAIDNHNISKTKLLEMITAEMKEEKPLE